MEQNRCIKCLRCVRGVLSKDGKSVFGPLRPGPACYKKIFVDPTWPRRLSDGRGPARPWSICPVGAILKKEVGFAVPIGRRKFDKAPIGSDVEQGPSEVRP